MARHSLSQVADHVLLHQLVTLVVRDRATTASLLAHLAEVEQRRLYAPSGCASMHEYCVKRLRMSEDAAYRRIRAARAAHKFPTIFDLLADGALNLTSVLLLAPQLRPANALELLSAASGKDKAGVEALLAKHFPQPDLPALIQRVDAPQLAPAPVSDTVNLRPAIALPPSAPAPLAPLAPERYALQLTVPQSTHDKLRYAQSLLGHAVPSGDLARVLDRALETLIAVLERRKFAPNARTRPSAAPWKARTVPAATRREVWQRDGGRCTFANDHGERCESATRLEFDHVTPVAQGGESTAANLRLRCRAHNQLAADRAFGAGFMQRKREGARRETPEDRDVSNALRLLGFRAEEARHGASLGAAMTGATLEQRLRVALSALAPSCVRIAPGAPPRCAARAESSKAI